MSDFIVNPPAANCPAPTPNTGASVTSAITYDGSALSCAVIQGGSVWNMNQVLTSINQSICDFQTQLATYSNQFTSITADVYNINNSLSALNALDISLGEINGTCLALGSTVSSAIQAIELQVCSNLTSIGAFSIDGFATIQQLELCCNTSEVGGVKQDFRAYGNKEFGYISSNLLVSSLEGGTAAVTKSVDRDDNTIVLDASKDNYIYVDGLDLLTTDGFKKKVVNFGDPTPAFTQDEVVLYKVTTDAVNVTATEDLRNFNYLPAGLLFGEIKAENLPSGAVTSSKLSLDAKLDYLADYSIAYNNRSLVDKEYVDNLVSASAQIWSTSGNDIYWDDLGSGGGVYIKSGGLLSGSDFTINGVFGLVDGSEALGYVLTTDANGLASWQESANSINILDEGISAEANISSIDFVGAGVTAVGDTFGGVTVTITGAVSSLDDLSDVSVAAAAANEMMYYNGSTWSSVANIRTDGTQFAVGNPTTIDAALHVKDAVGNDVAKFEGTGGTYGTINTAGLFAYSETFQYTFDNAASNPLVTGYVLTDLDGTGKLVWTNPSTLIGANSLQAVTTLGNTTTNDIFLQNSTIPSLYFDNTTFSLELTAPNVTSNKVVTIPDFTMTLIGAASGLSSDAVLRASATHTVSSASFKDDGTTTAFGVVPSATQRVTIASNLADAFYSENTGSGNAGYFKGSVRIVDGTESLGYVLTSDANGVASWAAASGADGNGIYDGSGSLGADTIITQNAFNLELQGNGGLFTTNANTSWSLGAVLNSGFQMYQVVSTHDVGHYIIQQKLNVSSDVYGQSILSNSTKTGAATLYGGHYNIIGTHASGTNVGSYFNAENALNNYSAVFDSGNIGFGETAVALADAIKLVQSLGVITFDGTTGGLFSITDDKSGQLFGVADVSGNDIMYADADWLVQLGNPFAVPFELNYNNVTGDTTFKTKAIDVNLNNYVITATGSPANIDVTKSIVKIRTTTSADLLDLPDGVDGQVITLIYTSEGAAGDDVTITPTNLLGFTTIFLALLGTGCELYFTDGTWVVKSLNGASLA